jgi:hypothetical protein
LTSIWVAILAFVLLADGKFLESGLANHIVWASIILSVVTVVGSKLSHFKLSKGELSVEGQFKDKQPAKDLKDLKDLEKL